MNPSENQPLGFNTPLGFNAPPVFKPSIILSEEEIAEYRYLKQHNFDTGFMQFPDPRVNSVPGHRSGLSKEYLLPLKKTNRYVSMQKAESIERRLTAHEYKILTSTRFFSDEFQIIEFRDILNKLIEAGIFKDEMYEPYPTLTNKQPYQPCEENSCDDEDYNEDDDELDESEEPKPINPVGLIDQAVLSSKIAFADSNVSDEEEHPIPMNKVMEIVNKEEAVNKIEESILESVVPPKRKHKNMKEYTGSFIEITVASPTYDQTLVNTINRAFVGLTDFIDSNVVVTDSSTKNEIIITICLDDLVEEDKVLTSIKNLIDNCESCRNVSAIRFRTDKSKNIKTFFKLAKSVLADVAVFKSITDKYSTIAYISSGKLSAESIWRIITLSNEYWKANK